MDLIDRMDTIGQATAGGRFQSIQYGIPGLPRDSVKPRRIVLHVFSAIGSRKEAVSVPEAPFYAIMTVFRVGAPYARARVF